MKLNAISINRESPPRKESKKVGRNVLESIVKLSFIDRYNLIAC